MGGADPGQPNSAVRPHREDHGRGDEGRARDTGRAQSLPEQGGREDGAGQGFEQGQQGGGAGGGGPQAAEVQRVSDGGRAGAQRDQQADGRETGPEADAARDLGHRHQGQAADGEPEPGQGEVVEPGHRPGADQGDRGEARRGEHGQARAGQRLPVMVRKTTISTPPAVSRQAATEIADRPAVRPSRLPVRPPVPHNSPDITR